MAKTIQKLQKQNKGAKPVKKGEKSTTSPQLDNDHSKYPFTATPYERTLTCPVCKTKGHIKRTCWQNAEHIAAMQAANFRPPKRRSTNSTQEERPGSGKKAKLEQAKTAQVSDLNASSRRVVFEPAGPFEGCFLATVNPLNVLLMHPVKSTALAVLATVPLTSMLGSPLTLIALTQELPQRLPYASYVTLVVRIICLEPFEQVT